MAGHATQPQSLVSPYATTALLEPPCPFWKWTLNPGDSVIAVSGELVMDGIGSPPGSTPSPAFRQRDRRYFRRAQARGGWGITLHDEIHRPGCPGGGCPRPRRLGYQATSFLWPSAGRRYMVHRHGFLCDARGRVQRGFPAFAWRGHFRRRRFSVQKLAGR